MRIFINIVFVFLFVPSVSAKQLEYTGSTPAGKEIRAFLGISLSDSIDFVRWVLVINDAGYSIACNYGIGKPNTNGFINNGKTIKLSGSLQKEGNRYHLLHADQFLNIVEINANLLHLLDDKNNLLIGNGGWSYTLNNTSVIKTNDIEISSHLKSFKDSVVFVGRTPCGIPGILQEGANCYKLKWQVVIYNDNNNSGTYTIYSNLWSRQQPKAGSWRIVKIGNNVLYKLTDSIKQQSIFLTGIDDNIFMFTDSEGRLLVGDEDFSYTLNRVAG